MHAWKWIGVVAVCLLAMGGWLLCTGPGAQTCSDGACCAGGQTCMTAECVADSDCPGAMASAWSACTSTGDACAVDGVQTRLAVAFACAGGMCRARADTETRACERATDGLTCDDGDACTVNDRCAGGHCQGEARRCDDGDACTADACSPALGCVHEPVPSCAAPPRSACHDAGAPCDTGNPCAVGEIRCIEGRARCVAVGLAGADTVCRPARGLCDLAEYCTGTSTECPADRLSSAESVCRPAAGACDRAELCTGTSPDCPPDELLAGGTVCRAGVNECAITRTCTGSSAQCPEDDAGCDTGAYCILATCWARPTLDIQGNEGASCSDLARVQAGQGPLLRAEVHGRAHAPFRFLRMHASCAGAFYLEQPDIACDEGTVGKLDAEGRCSFSIHQVPADGACPARMGGRWRAYVEIDGQRSNSGFVDVYHSSPACPDNPRTCEEAARYCPFTGACTEESCAAGDASERARAGLPEHAQVSFQGEEI